eukprot:6183352-Pleurochrysis_carterae.AAC.2
MASPAKLTPSSSTRGMPPSTSLAPHSSSALSPPRCPSQGMVGGRKRVLPCRRRRTSCACSTECVTLPRRKSVSSFPWRFTGFTGSHAGRLPYSQNLTVYRTSYSLIARLAALRLERRSIAGSTS